MILSSFPLNTCVLSRTVLETGYAAHSKTAPRAHQAGGRALEVSGLQVNSKAKMFERFGPADPSA